MSAADQATMECAHKVLKVVAMRLGYSELKKSKEKLCFPLHKERMFLCPCLRNTESHFAMVYDTTSGR